MVMFFFNTKNKQSNYLFELFFLYFYAEITCNLKIALYYIAKPEGNLWLYLETDNVLFVSTTVKHEYQLCQACVWYNKTTAYGAVKIQHPDGNKK